MKGDIKDREYLYRLIVEQLFYDGHQAFAGNLVSIAGLSGKMPPPSNKLFKLIQQVQQMELDTDAIDDQNFDEDTADNDEFYETYGGLDPENDADVGPCSPELSQYETIFLTTHKGPSRAAVYADDGKMFATGSLDCSIKIVDVEKCISKHSGLADQDANPVIRTLFDHTEEVTALAFHPHDQLLVSGSADCTLKFFDYGKAAVRRASRSIAETGVINSLSFHPSGDYLAVGTDNKVLRLYSTETQQCWVSSHPADQHSSGITCTDYSGEGRLLATGSKDGEIKIWDGVSSRCIESFKKAHDGAEICSVKFARNGKYLLTAGFDSIVKLWELSVNRCLLYYSGVGVGGASQKLPINAEFNHTEDFVMYPDERSGSLWSWDSRSMEKKKILSLGHSAAVRRIRHSPCGASFITCSDDSRVRFWYKKYRTKQFIHDQN
uniref:Cleavage stimulation factor 50 kDa subunit n=1 Tax=Rhabditophanes sp. KR3021 TaxID=114890 RepID=A0AC35TGF8_9BILA